MTAYAIDFGRPDGGDSFQWIAAKELSGRTLIRLRPPGVDGTTLEMSTSAYATYYENAIQEYTSKPRALLGYCAGGFFALALAARFRRSGTALPVILFDTVATTARHVANEFSRGLRDIGWSEQMPFGVNLLSVAESAVRLLEEDLASGLAYLETVAKQFAIAFLTKRGIPMETVAVAVDGMLARQSACLRYVAAATVRADLCPEDRPYVIVSKTLAPIAESFWAASGAEVLVVDCDHRSLLRSDVAYRHMLNCIGGDLGESEK